jgi:hypothetical protein
MITEWDLQYLLTTRWAAEGLRINGSHHCLVAWEVMFPSWRINDSRAYWAEPSIDFLVADESFNLTVVELKRNIAGIKPCWLALSQVTHRAAELLRSITLQKIENAYLSCWSGGHGRLNKTKHVQPLTEFHREFFRLNSLAGIRLDNVQRCVAALNFAPSWQKVLDEFNQLIGGNLHDRIHAELKSKAAEREVKRLLSIPINDLEKLATPVSSLEIPIEAFQ